MGGRLGGVPHRVAVDIWKCGRWGSELLGTLPTEKKVHLK